MEAKLSTGSAIYTCSINGKRRGVGEFFGKQDIKFEFVVLVFLSVLFTSVRQV